MGNFEIKENILFQMDMCWQLYLYHITNLGEQEAHWSIDPQGLQVRKKDDEWCIDWPESESYEMGPASIAWIMWHIIYWWSMALNWNFGSKTLKKEDVPSPGSIEKAKATLESLHEQW